MPRIVIDLTTLARWQGTPTGIPRCQSKYAGHALRHFPDAAFTIYDPRSAGFRILSRRWAEAILKDGARIDMSMMPDPTGLRPRSIEKIPRPFHSPFWWITQSRRKTVAMLEGWRIRTMRPGMKKLLGRLQLGLLSSRRRPAYLAPDGTRIDWPSLEVAAPDFWKPEPGDTTIAMQFDWADVNIAALARMKAAAGFRHIVLCHDIIPIQFPEWYSADDVAIFRNYYDNAFAIADRVMFTSQRSATDAAAYCRSIGVTIADRRVVPMGSDPLPQAANAPLPPGLASGKYVLFVSTIEPRKNHRMLVEAWRRLIADGTIAASGFKLVFVGRRGWMMDSLFSELRSDPALHQSIQHLTGIDDASLSTLYRDAAFCVYPPKFEGFGLPPIEALAAGKAVIVSNAGPMPEVVGEFGVCLDPDDTDAWTARLREWINGSPEREAFSTLARTRYRALGWDEAARNFFAAALERA